MYEIEERIRYSEVGYNGTLTRTGLVNYFQDCSMFHSEDVGLGLKYLFSCDRVWVLSSWQIDILQMPKLAQKVKVRTWPYEFKGFIGYRNYTMTDQDGQLLAAANSIWTLVDIQKRQPVRITAREIDGYEIDERLDMEYAPRKIKTEGEGIECPCITVGKERIDTNGHMNNSQYIAVAEEFLPKESRVSRIRVEYRKEVMEKEKLLPVLYQKEGKSTVVLKGAESTDLIHAIVEFSY